MKSISRFAVTSSMRDMHLKNKYISWRFIFTSKIEKLVDEYDFIRDLTFDFFRTTIMEIRDLNISTIESTDIKLGHI